MGLWAEWRTVYEQAVGAVSPPYSLVLPIVVGSPALVEEGALAPKSGKDALELLRATDHATDDGVSKPIAHTTLVDGGFTDSEADQVLMVLQQRGYVYYVEGRVKITE